MTPPKQKAKELVEKFVYLKDREENECKHPLFSLLKIKAKQCALICVDEILKRLRQDNKMIVFGYPEDKTVLGFDIKYWQEVKQEINKI